MVRIGVIGLGYWGPNLLRCLSAIDDCQVTVLCDRNAERLRRYHAHCPNAVAVSEADDAIDPDLVDAVIVATPTATHYSLARQALEAGLHVFVEKPLATRTAECEELIEIAAAKNLTLFVGHVFLYTAPVAKLKELVEGGDLGDICYISSTRLNLGPVRQDVNALWDLAPHDVSIMLELMGALPTRVTCTGLAYLNESVHDVCTLNLHFASNKMGIIHVSWLDPHKQRVMTVVGNQKMAVYDDLAPLEKIKVYDIGIEAPTYADSFGDFQFSYRYGDTYSPRIVESEPLKLECQSFIDAIVTGAAPRTDGHNGRDVVSVIEAAQRSLENDSHAVAVERRRESVDAVLVSERP
ncbi:MAG: Gfo/Idh/MocA family oxidoreductase [Planctomycetales bacterium]|nr:Gfo/Idh/MocA family oxidoreductase [Planctomycetales bacterium]